MPETITIIGAGMVGICTALSLAERGHKVQIIDKAAPGQGGATFGNAGIISPWSLLPQPVPGIWKNIPNLIFGEHKVLKPRLSMWHKLVPWGLSFLRHANTKQVYASAEAMQYLCEPSIDMYRQHLKGTGAEDLVQSSWYIHAFRTEEMAKRWDETAIDYVLRRAFGANIECINAGELKDLEPALGPVFKAAVLVKDQARARAPGRIAEVLFQKACQMGTELIQTEVRHIEQEEGDWRVICADRDITTSKLVLATGAWSAKLLEPLGIKIPLLAERGYHVEFSNPGAELKHSVMDVDAKLVASSMEGGLRLAGASEFCKIDAPVDPKRQALMEQQAKTMVPDLNISEGNLWMGHRPSLPDSLPMLGTFENRSGLYAAFGHSHYGLMMAPKSGQVVADLVEQRTPNHDLAAYSTKRFA
ncbi:D-amino-acid dehydrogenase [Epibacterium ulvae]|uniref:D-amino-acid dehydrogenase n=1 Tax=Epibacterium ulvae TaxID=1156985 RepID=A0A1G5R224_9RHOB|nr:FAD-binding oxidoreductase [Epibacterium ulvae]SCZ67860.1 D-amino-acid dehydrogenase [Epibacterium ulvae]